MHSFQLNVLGMDISFRTDADSARIERMELFDLLETRVVELLGQIDTLREENKTLQEKVNALDEENKTLKESLEQEQHTKEEINGRIDTLLSTIREFTAEA